MTTMTTANTTTTINTTTNMTLIDAIIKNRGFKGRKVSKEQVGVRVFNEWHELLDNLLICSYDVASKEYNGENGDVATIFTTLKSVWDYIGTLENGAKLRSDSDCANTLKSFCIADTTKKSQEYKYIESKISLNNNIIKSYTVDGTINGKAKNGTEKGIESLRKENKDSKIELEELRYQANHVTKEKTRQKNSKFYVDVENYVADKALGLLVKTNEEIKAEEKARKDARNKKANENKKKKEEKIKALFGND